MRGSPPRAAILMVDDRPANLAALEGTLAPLGHRMVKANSGREALTALGSEEFALVLLDVQMPDLSGFETAKLIRADPRTARVPIIFVTAMERDALQMFEGYAQGAVDYLLKPLDPTILRAKVRVFVNLFLKEKELEARGRALLERERREHERRTEERVQRLVDSMPLCLWALRADGTVYYCNRAWTDYSRLTSATSDPMVHAALVHEDDRRRVRKGWLAAFARAEPFEFQCRLRRAADGVYRWHIGRVVPERDDDGGLAGWIVTAADIETQKRAEGETARLMVQERQAREGADAANRAKDEFLATLSHELRTPLSAMIGWTRLLRTASLSPERTQRALETIERNAKAQAALIDDILDVSRIVTGKLRIEMQPIDLGTIAADALDAIQPIADAKGIEIKSNVSNEMAGMSINGDRARLNQVLANLLSNAVKFTPRGGLIELDVERAGPAVRLRVRDNGRGITAGFAPFIFDRFRQSDSNSTRAYGGLGLGLAIVRHLVDLHGGTVSGASEGEGQGATFTVTLPFREPALGDAETDPAIAPLRRSRSPSVPSPDVNLAGIKVLLVDDEPDARELLTEVLEQYGAKVVAAASADEAFTALRMQRPDVLLSDIGLPGEDGYSLIRRVRELSAADGGTTPAAALTAFARSEDAQRALAAGFLRHAVKPIQPAVLAALVHDLVGMGSGGAPGAASSGRPAGELDA